MARRVVQTIAQIFDETQIEEQRQIPVAAYARVSTEKEEQEDSFERQVEHYTQLINSRPEWRLVKIYADPGISGTRAEKRPEFMQMIEDCRAGKIQKVLVKSISRFARNTVDALTYIRELKELGIGILFESENIDTLTPGGEVLLTILAAMAEQESRTISSNIKWAWQRKFQNGDVNLNTGLMLGYRKTDKKDEEGHAIYESTRKRRRSSGVSTESTSQGHHSAGYAATSRRTESKPNSAGTDGTSRSFTASLQTRSIPETRCSARHGSLTSCLKADRRTTAKKHRYTMWRIHIRQLSAERHSRW